MPVASQLRPPAPAPAPAPVGSPHGAAPAAARLLLARGVHPALRWGRLSDFATELRALYPDSAEVLSGYLWVRDGRLTAPAKALILAITSLPARGLQPADYDANWLSAQLAASTREALLDEERIASVDVALSVAALRVSWALHRGRVRARDMHPEFRLRRAPFDLPFVVRQLSRTGAVDSLWSALEPDYLHYQLTKAALARYRILAADSTLRPLPPMAPGQSRLRVGMRWTGVPALRRLLVAFGDLAADSVAVGETRYVAPMVGAVSRFQRRHGMTADGELGPTTRAALDVPLASRINAIELALERWRWMPRLDEQHSDAPLVVVNIPAFRLYAFQGPIDDERGMLSMNVVVGQAMETETPVFADTLSQIVFAPYWDVPASISGKEIWPKAKADPTYLSRNHYEVVQGRVRQRPGPWNSLGKVKFLFPNDYAIYMHDTPSRKPFGRARRDASHGCIRLEDPRRFARWLLPDTATWDDRWLDDALRRDSSLVVEVPRPRPVMLMYATAMSRQNGETEFYPDIYLHDEKLRTRIARGYPHGR
jgi:L,D-transpeptidase YcbB